MDSMFSRRVIDGRADIQTSCGCIVRTMHTRRALKKHHSPSTLSVSPIARTAAVSRCHQANLHVSRIAKSGVYRWCVLTIDRW